MASGGVKASLLGSVTRPGIGDQVTYAGHPLYLFDMGASQITGEGFDEATLPPWHGVWWLMAPSGRALAWPGMLTTTTISHKTVLATLMLTLVGWKAYPVYSYSKDSSSRSACSGSCAVAWPPVLTGAHPGVANGLSASKVGVLMRSDGTDQVTYGGRPLYLFANEQIVPQGTDLVAAGNGNGIKVGRGTFRLVKV